MHLVYFFGKEKELFNTIEKETDKFINLKKYKLSQ